MPASRSTRIQELDFFEDPFIRQHTSDSVELLSEQLIRCDQISPHRYQTLVDELSADPERLIVGQKDYISLHRLRFFEVTNAVLILTRDKVQPRLLEFGVSTFSSLYKEVHQSLEIHTSDRPTDDSYIGFNKKRCLEISGARNHLEIDLESIADLDSVLTEYEHRFDILLFTEVLEHLVVNPIEVLNRLLRFLKKDGYLYLTTPNFFSRHRMQQIRNWENPQEVFPGRTDNWDAHFHHREYGLKELIRFAEEAGGQVRAYYFSDCWERDVFEPLRRGRSSRHANIVLVASPA